MQEKTAHKLRFRQIHLDFHTSEKISGIGEAFDKKEWQETLKLGRVNSITCFSKCHHGWSYHPTKVGRIHPHLNFNLLRAQIDACLEIDVKVPVYISAGVDNMKSHECPHWREVGIDGRYNGWARSVNEAGFHKMCFNSPYLDYLCRQIEEAVTMFPEANGIFLDIISHGQCCCNYCLDIMEKEGLDAEKEEDRIKCSELALLRYYKMTTEACRIKNPNMPVFHNSGHVTKGKTDILKYFSHLELESLPTGGWGYDHFPLSAKYCSNLGLDMLGMTGKFHTSWGEFGGYKHPNALRYECAAMVALGAKCSIGDQLHPCGKLDKTTYSIIGRAYSEVEKIEEFCDDVSPVCDIGVISSEANNKEHNQRENPCDAGAARILLESHFLFSVIDEEMDFSPYKMLILPDNIKISAALKMKIDSYLRKGGKLFLTGKSGLDEEKKEFIFDIGAKFAGESPFCPDYVLPRKDLCPDFVSSPTVMYMNSQRIKTTDGESLGEIFDPYFNRTFRHFCSHQHAPPKAEASGFDCGVRKGNILYLAHPVFSIYYGYGAVAYRDYVVKAIKYLLGEENISLRCDLPSSARVFLQEQKEKSRYILHLLYAPKILRGGKIQTSSANQLWSPKPVEIIEELPPLKSSLVKLKTDRKICSVKIEPDGIAVDYKDEGKGCISLYTGEFSCHRIISISYK